MTAVHEEVAVPVAAPVEPETAGLPRNAALYLAAVAIATALAGVPSIAHLSPDTHGWVAFFVLATCAAVAQLFVARTPRNAARYYTTNVFLIASVLLLPPELVALMGIVQHVPEWLKMRYPWYIQTFNILNYTFNCLTAWAAVYLITHAEFGVHPDVRWALAGVAACLVFVGSNHFLLATMLHFAQRKSLRRSELFSMESLSTDLILAALGVGLAAFWLLNPWLIPVVIAPLVLIHRSLSVPALEEEARIDPKTGLSNARHFAFALREELARAKRFDRPMSVIMADLDLFRDFNNSYGHLAGDAMLRHIGDVFRTQLREYDVPARFGGEEFAVLLPETPPEEALEIAERIRRTVAGAAFEIETASEPLRATLSLGVAGFPRDGMDVNELIHQADLAVYRAKLQGRNRALSASSESVLAPADRGSRLAAVPSHDERPLPAARELPPPEEMTLVSVVAAPVERRQVEPEPHEAASKPHMPVGPRFLALSPALASLVVFVAFAGAAAGALGLWISDFHDLPGFIAVLLAVGVGQALALELEGGSISISAVGALAGAAMFGPRAALPLAVVMAAVQWSSERGPVYRALFNVGALTLASLSAATVFSIGGQVGGNLGHVVTAVAGLVAGGAYFVVNTGLTSGAMALEGHDKWRAVWNERFSWLLPHYVAFGAVAAAIALAYVAIGLIGLAVFVLPLVLMRKTMAAYLGHTQRSNTKLREAAETIRSQNASLEQANSLLKERSTAAMESLSATVDARDAYTAGHSRRVQQLSLAIGR